MAPKAPKFELKTPKGTKDCKLVPAHHRALPSKRRG